MDLSQSNALGELHQALAELCGPAWTLRVKATYGATPDDVVGIDVHLTRATSQPDESGTRTSDKDGEQSGLLTIKDVARYLGVSPRTVQTIVAEGGLTPIKVRSQTRFSPENVETYVRSQARGRGGRRL